MNTIKDRSQIMRFLMELIDTKVDDSDTLIESINQIINIDTMVIDAEMSRLKHLKIELAKAHDQYDPNNNDRELQKLLSLDAQIEDSIERTKLIETMLHDHSLMMLQKSIDYLADHGMFKG